MVILRVVQWRLIEVDGGMQLRGADAETVVAVSGAAAKTYGPNALRRTGRNGRAKAAFSPAIPDGPFVARVATHARSYDLAKVADACGAEWANAVVNAWPRALADVSEAHGKRLYGALLLWTRWLRDAAATSASGRVRSQLKCWTGQDRLNSSDLEDAKREYTAALHDLTNLTLVKTRNARTRSDRIYYLSGFIKRMASAGIMSRGHGLKGLKRASSLTTMTPALAELGRGGRTDWSRGTTPSPYPPLDGADDGLAALSTPDLLDRYEAVNEIRRNAVRDRHERYLLQAYAWKKEGDAVLARADLPTVADVDATLSAGSRGRAMSPLAMLASLEALRPLMGLTGAPSERMRTILVKYVSQKHNGAFKLKHLPHGLRKAISLAGGAKEVVKRLEGNLKAMQAAHTIVLVDTGSTTACIDLLPEQPFVGETRRGQRTIRTVEVPKMRAGGKMVEGMLLDRARALGEGDSERVFGVEMKVSIIRLAGRLAGAEAIRLWQELSSPIRNRARDQHDGQAELLWIVPNSGWNASWIGLYGIEAGHSTWRKFLSEVADDPEIGGLRITRRMLRTTWQQAKAIENGVDHVQAQLMGQHSSSATTGLYIDSAAIRSLLMYRYRRYLELYEVAVSSTIQGSAAKLGMSIETYGNKLALAVHTGLGIHCLDTHAGFRPGVEEGKPCPADACHECAFGVFKVEEETLEALHLARIALDAARDQYVERNPGRWLRLWLPVDASTQAWAEILSGGVHRLRYARAGIRVRAKLENETVCLPLIW